MRNYTVGPGSSSLMAGAETGHYITWCKAKIGHYIGCAKYAVGNYHV